MRSFDLFQVIFLGGVILAPAISPLLRSRRNTPQIVWREAITVAAIKIGIAAVVVALMFTSFPAWLAGIIGEAIYLVSTVGGFVGAMILLFAGFWRPTDSSIDSARRMIRGEPPLPPPLGSHVVKWSLIGAAIFTLAIAAHEHPFEIAKNIVSSRQAHSSE